MSDDLVTWKTLSTAIYRGEQGSYDDLDIWTGCSIYHDEKFYTFYTPRCSNDQGTINRTALAMSVDGIAWEKHHKNPLFVPDPRWYYTDKNQAALAIHCWPFVDCRDICVVPDPEENGFWGFVVMRVPAGEIAQTSVIGLCHSMDLVHWSQYPPCFVPEK